MHLTLCILKHWRLLSQTANYMVRTFKARNEKVKEAFLTIFFPFMGNRCASLHPQVYHEIIQFASGLRHQHH